MMHACGRGRPGQGALSDMGMRLGSRKRCRNHPPEEAELSRRGNGGAQVVPARRLRWRQIANRKVRATTKLDEPNVARVYAGGRGRRCTAVLFGAACWQRPPYSRLCPHLWASASRRKCPPRPSRCRTTGQRPARRCGGRHAGRAGHVSAAPPGRGRVSALILSWTSM